jgi:hypothetical protein
MYAPAPLIPRPKGAFTYQPRAIALGQCHKNIFALKGPHISSSILSNHPFIYWSRFNAKTQSTEPRASASGFGVRQGWRSLKITTGRAFSATRHRFSLLQRPK